MLPPEGLLLPLERLLLPPERLLLPPEFPLYKGSIRHGLAFSRSAMVEKAFGRSQRRGSTFRQPPGALPLERW